MSIFDLLRGYDSYTYSLLEACSAERSWWHRLGCVPGQCLSCMRIVTAVMRVRDPKRDGDQDRETAT